MANRFVHFEIVAENPEKAAEFYTKVFGWKISKWEGGAVEYWLVMTGEKGEPGIDGGIVRASMMPPGTKTINTVMVEDIDAFQKKVTDAGGKVLVPKYSIPGVGQMAYCADAEGVVFGLHTGEQK